MQQIKKYQLNLENINKVEKVPGIYIIYIDKNFARLTGDTNIIYIGKAKRDLRKRLLTFTKGFIFCQEHEDLEPRPIYLSRHSIWRFWDLKNSILKPELTFHYETTPTEQQATKLEMARLKEFEKKHLELPPLNHSN